MTASNQTANFSTDSSSGTAQAPVVPAITWLNMTGDVTITWDSSNKDSIKALVAQKMKEGYSFFILVPRVIAALGNKKVRLKSEDQLDNATGVIVPDSQVAAIVGSLGDPEVEAVVGAGKASRANAPTKSLTTTRRAVSADEVVEHQTVAVRAVVGG
jgi:hypothetical protein